MAQEDKGTIYCSLVGILPFTAEGHSLFEPDEHAAPWAITHVAAAALAVEHFNSRNSIVVRELEHEIYQNCPVQLLTPNRSDENNNTSSNSNSSSNLTSSNRPWIEFVDSESRDSVVSEFLMNKVEKSNPNDRAICAIVGPYSDSAAFETSAIAMGLKIPVVSHGSKINELSREHHPSIIRTNVNWHPLGEAMIHWLVTHAKRSNYLATIYTSNLMGKDVAHAIDNAAKERTDVEFKEIQHNIIAPPYNGGFAPNQSVRYACWSVKQSTFRTILVVVRSLDELSHVADAAEEFGLNVPGEYVWMLAGDLNYAETINRAQSNANLTKILNGMVNIRILDGFDVPPEVLSVSNDHNGLTNDEEHFDAFSRAWQTASASNTLSTRSLNTLLDQINAMNPISDPEKPGYYHADPDFFETNMPHPGAGFLYDAIIAVGMGRCQQYHTQNNNPLLHSDGSTNDLSLIQAIVERTNFTGATGNVLFGEGKHPRNRRRDSVFYGAFNFRIPPPTSPQEGDSNGAGFPTTDTGNYYLTSVLKGSPVNGNWYETNKGPFVYSTGTATPPLLLRDIPPQNYLSSGVQVFGLTVMCISSLLAVVAVAWLACYSAQGHMSQVIRGAQPFFLYHVFAGVIIMSLSILFVSFDESHGWSSSALSGACQAYPWFLSIGYCSMYLAMFSKLLRINMILQFRRRQQVLARHVLWPFALLLSAVVIVLVIWTSIDPLHWERNEVDSATGESYGKCLCEHYKIFISVLAVLCVVATLLTAVMAWKTKDIDERYSDARWIFYTIFLQLQVLLVGIPILIVLDNSSRDATYMGQALLTGIIAWTTVLLLAGPKIVRVYKTNKSENEESSDKKRPGLSQKRGSINFGVRVFGDISTGQHFERSSSSKEKVSAASQAESAIEKKLEAPVEESDNVFGNDEPVDEPTSENINDLESPPSCLSSELARDQTQSTAHPEEEFSEDSKEKRIN